MNDRPSYPEHSDNLPNVLGLDKVNLTTSFAHRALSLIGACFVLFEILFLELYVDSLWFGLDISKLGVLAIVLTGILAHWLLSWLESPRSCRLFYLLRKGKPAFVYKQWLTLARSGITFGLKHVSWSAMDELCLNFFGNLQIKSYAICGKESTQPDLVLTVPFSVAPPSAQATLINTIKSYQPNIKLNNRLSKHLAKSNFPGIFAVQLVSISLLALVLLDLGNSSFIWLQMLKEYYLAQTEARLEHKDLALAHLAAADNLKDHPAPVSWITPRLMSQGKSAADTLQARAEALWYLNQKQEAITSLKQAITIHPTNFRLYLHLSRLLCYLDRPHQAEAQVNSAIARHRNAFLPYLYMLAILRETSPKQVAKFYKLYWQELSERVLGQEPLWPPGGNAFFSEVFYSDDVEFIFTRLFSNKHVNKKAY